MGDHVAMDSRRGATLKPSWCSSRRGRDGVSRPTSPPLGTVGIIAVETMTNEKEFGRAKKWRTWQPEEKAKTLRIYDCAAWTKIRAM
jgi:hypothetical protein